MHLQTMALQSESSEDVGFEVLPRNRLYSSTLIKISRGFPRCVIVIGPCKALAMISPDLRERSLVEYRISGIYNKYSIAANVVCQALKYRLLTRAVVWPRTRIIPQKTHQRQGLNRLWALVFVC
jgi:hypothetical protein